MTEFHLMRPMWLFTLLPLIILGWYLFKQTTVTTAWNNVCDAHLLPYLIQNQGYGRRTISQVFLFLSLLMMIIGLAGPTWSRLPVPTYQHVQPRVVVLDMSDAMLANDLKPDRLSRAKFKLHDLFQHKDAGQFGLVVYTDEPFVVSPLTEDGQTIDALLSSLTHDIMPVVGQRLSSALDQARLLLVQAGFQHGQLLVLTASSPSREDIEQAKTLSQTGIETSIMPILGPEATLNPLYKELAKAGRGELIRFSNTSTDLDQWLAATEDHHEYTASAQNDIPVWRDQGRWFLIPSLIFLIPAFRRGWLS